MSLLPPPETRLCLARGVTVHLTGASTTAGLGAAMMDCGPFGLPLLDAFRTPRSVHEVSAELCSHVSSRGSWTATVTAIAALWRAGLLVEPDGMHVPPGRGFSAAGTHVAMLNDVARTTMFLEAIRRTVRPGDVVVDIGTGTGVLAIAAAQAGARRVFAIEATGIADAAEAMFAANGVADRITLIRGWSTEVTIEEPAQVIVSETLGHGALAEGIAAIMNDARRRFAAPAARMIPSVIRVVAQPVTVPDAEWRRHVFHGIDTSRWATSYGMQFDSLVDIQSAFVTRATLPAAQAATWLRPCAPAIIGTCDLMTGAHAEDTLRVPCRAIENGTINGLLLSWEAELAAGLTITTDARTATDTSHWRVQLLPVVPAIATTAGQTLTLSVSPDCQDVRIGV